MTNQWLFRQIYVNLSANVTQNDANSHMAHPLKKGSRINLKIT
ncbi:hypothetical protein C8N25_10625 [Algoriphagus antarcticus]|uniref:Uncharacterized protein n=1 Tax=Algoriphagus antarcticus TaxID=238540 RepID=A0A3E0DWQ1_9BACT|nr:hypothetical protein C8N25_10625 [Algoriphagus antarcticus]